MCHTFFLNAEFDADFECIRNEISTFENGLKGLSYEMDLAFDDM
jgi:hypothetical protein